MAQVRARVLARSTRRGAGRVVSKFMVFALLLAVLLQPATALARSTGDARPAAFESMSAELAKAYSGKWIDVNLSRQRLTAYVGQRVVYTSLMSSGTAAHPTVTGRFTIRRKLASQTMTGPGYRLPNVPYVMYFYSGYAIHGTYWHNNFGKRMSHGCVNLPTSAAAWVYRWAPVGTPVYVHY